jgi:hypothetical protein
MHPQPQDRPGEAPPLHRPPRQPLGDHDRLVATHWLRAAELDEFGRVRLNGNRGNQSSDVIGAHPSRSSATSAEDHDSAAGYVEATLWCEVGFLECIWSHQYCLHRRCSQPLLVCDLGALERRSSRSIQAGGGDKDEPPHPCPFCSIDERRNAKVIDFPDGLTASAGQTPPHGSDHGNDSFYAFTSRGQTSWLSQVRANHRGISLTQRRIVGSRPYEAPHLMPLIDEQTGDAASQFPCATDDKDHASASAPDSC